MKRYFYKLPFRFKLWWAKQFLYMFKGFGSTFNDDIILYNELKNWIDTKGKQINKTLKSEICCPKCQESENIHFNTDYSKYGLPETKEFLCNECGTFFTSKLE